MKENPICLGIDDASFSLKGDSSKTYLIGAICQGTRLVSVRKKTIDIDGDDATKKVIEMIKSCDKHVQYVLTDTITFAGFNLIDLKRIHEETLKPIIAITERKINLEAVKEAIIKNFPKSYKKKLHYIVNAGLLYEMIINTAGGPAKIFFHHIGIEYDEIKALLQKLCIDSKLPEPIRIAHLIGKMF